jgi:predicted AAA+ superfamily ATPase
MDAYRPRLVDGLVSELIGELPALMITGPRATGKTTTAARLARSVVSLDRPREAEAFRADPDAALRGLAEPVLLDEWQVVPEVLGAVKRAVDADPRGGRFILTGSVRAELDSATWPGTGRVVTVSMTGLAMRELYGDPSAPPFLDRILEGAIDGQRSSLDLQDYVAAAMTSGFPEAVLRLSGRARQRWLEGYVDVLLTRDAAGIEGVRDPLRLRRFFQALALNSAGTVEGKTLYEAAGISRNTAEAYERLLQNLLVTESIPAWSTNRLKRLVRAPKRYLVDPGLLGAVLRADVRTVLGDGDLLGRVVDTFVLAQLRAELPVCASRPQLYHLREAGGRHEVDLIAEYGAGRTVGIEIKASAAPKPDAARHLAWLRDELGDRFLCGLVLHTGPNTYRLGERITALPISAIWQQP